MSRRVNSDLYRAALQKDLDHTEPGGARAEIVEPRATAIQSSTISANISPARAQPARPKPEVTPKPVTDNRLSWLPTLKFRHEGSLSQPSVEPGLGSSAVVPRPFYPQTGTGMRNLDDVYCGRTTARRSLSGVAPPQWPTPVLPHHRCRGSASGPSKWCGGGSLRCVG